MSTCISRGFGFGEEMEKMILQSSLAYASSLAYVFLEGL